jgi:tRNA U34 5-methylaminomethyl-2-thiouridine-forming methyltransferase MnmC
MELEMLEDWLNNPEPVDEFREHTTMQMLAEENSEEFLKNFGQGAEQMITVMSRHATTDEGKFQSEEQLEEARIQPAQGEMAEANLSEKVTEQQVIQEEEKTAELNFAIGWQVEATKRYKDGMGDLVDLPICREEVQWSRLQEESQPWEQLDEIIEEIRRMMIISTEAFNKGKLSRRRPAIVVGKMQQQHQSRGAYGQIQGTVWDPGGFQQWCWEAHEQEIMIFAAEEYDAGA